MNKNIEYISHEDVPDTWLDRCSGDGHKDKFSEGHRPCARCGKYPDEITGDDVCMSSLGHVVNACCGHGDQEGYIMFDDSRAVYGLFTLVDLNEEKEELTARENYQDRIDEAKRKMEFYEKQIEKYKKLYNRFAEGEYLFEKKK